MKMAKRQNLRFFLNSGRRNRLLKSVREAFHDFLGNFDKDPSFLDVQGELQGKPFSVVKDVFQSECNTKKGFKAIFDAISKSMQKCKEPKIF